MRGVWRRLWLWTIVCGISAAPSFALASDRFNDAAMVVGVCLFIAAYTAVTGTSFFQRLRRLPFVRRTLYIGYGARLALSLLHGTAFLVAWSGAPSWWLFALVDVWPGVLSIELVQNLFGREPETFVGTLLTTLIQGTLLNAIVLVFMLVVYGLQRMFLTPPPVEAPHGFDVVPPTANAVAGSPAAAGRLPDAGRA
jgi:hypothetical protein